VAVDPRWLADALTNQYSGLTRDATVGRASASDYIEKIFQIPIRLGDLTPAHRKAVLDAHLAAGVGPSQGGLSEDGSPTPDATPDPDRALLIDSLFTTTTEDRVDRLIQALQLEAWELEYLHELAPLLGCTPRAVKRFSNTYQLARVLFSDGGAAGAQGEAGLRRLGFLLALASGRPAVAEALTSNIASAHGNTITLSTALHALVDDQPDASSSLSWLQGRVEATWTLDTLTGAAEAADRFAFRLPGLFPGSPRRRALTTA
jgi:hypothetical protein